jgi:phage tail-like protein
MADVVPDVLVASYWTLEAQGKVTGVFSKLEGGGSKNKLVEYRYVNAKGQPMIKYEPAAMELTPYKLSRGQTGNLEMIKWRKLVEEGKMQEARASVSIVSYTTDGQEVARVNLERAWVSELTNGPLDPKSGDFVVETVTIVYEEATYLRTGATT